LSKPRKTKAYVERKFTFERHAAKGNLAGALLDFINERPGRVITTSALARVFDREKFDIQVELNGLVSAGYIKKIGPRAYEAFDA
jgi:hypothetical protein